MTGVPPVMDSGGKVNDIRYLRAYADNDSNWGLKGTSRC
ncbi:hypothetical protein SAMN05216387_107140 [Nitrosovibrio tenuis]|uniref:Uncharacterized protein n=1 Tax=Nitrosovibrio tenuis TaxID=1233 RepID=A0A1H7NVN1_9PROT|nr:hypothetical protein SAMN05216387_107140 [Nitrosovibrio tenuis]